MSDKSTLAELNEELTGRSGPQRVDNGQDSKAITVQPTATPKQDVNIILLNQSAIQDLKKSMTYGVHYGPPYKNSKKDTLLKPGAEWTQKLFGIRPQYEMIESIIQPNFEDLSKSWIMFRYRCQMIEISSGLVVGEAIGTCHSLEDKYHWRKATRTCVDPNCNGDVYRSKYPDNLPEEKRGWYCKECKAKYAADDTRITGQEVGQAVNANPMDLVNTLDKIAQKRAYVSAVLNATAASSIFAPGDDAIDDIDVSDIVEADYTEAPTSTTPEPQAETETPTVKYNFDTVLNRTMFMYKHMKHAENSINNMIDVSGEIEPTDSDTTAVWKIFEHRCKSKPYNLTIPKVCEILTQERLANGSNVPVVDMKQYVKDGGTVETAWAAVVAHHENASAKPAEPKGNGKAKDEPEAPTETVDIPF